MSIQTKGQQKYYDFIEERVKKLRTGMIVWGSLLAVALIGMFSDVLLAIILAAVGAALAILNLKSQKALNEKLNVVEDREEFFRQLASSDLLEFKAARLIIMKDYLLQMKEDVFIYPFSEMEKVEVGIQGKVGKTLFLTDRQGARHEIMSCMKDDGKQEEFDKVYGALIERVGKN
ncbi:MAG: hypothetical protein HFG81_08515 [Dorea sp.]|jgi:hypothetical protein|uniref:hypothetical protein n=1 Tax=Sporofaciens musculi TaxID=2681861 RepID=UPI00216BFB3A|nr:hypothetical protein [Sporofaciens musculi]MCI9422743.1 hypothetical protein [Dorea sp.]